MFFSNRPFGTEISLLIPPPFLIWWYDSMMYDSAEHLLEKQGWNYDYQMKRNQKCIKMVGTLGGQEMPREWTYAVERQGPTLMNDDVSIVHSIYGMLNSFQKR